VTQQAYYCYTFRYDAAVWDGIPVEVFRQALSAEIGLGVGTVYQPLNACILYQPQTKRRHYLNEEYWQAINPARFDLPVCKKAHEEEAAVLVHYFLLAERTDMDQIIQAVAKLYEGREQLKGAR
jgi:L-glutamine:2-deoxy-scyllo-inosose/3-amino-2,3-dideoxy-scyllo-inosose aminotransferase